jgi:DNA polymerase lambda
LALYHQYLPAGCSGKILASETEEEIFKILGVPWQEPHQRVRH